ncbi:MAG: SWIM zinc finger family protein, partial [Thermodesulfobacteriota bacterium]
MSKKDNDTWYRMLYEYFKPHIRTRGNAYFHDGRVNLEKAEKNYIKGTVFGTRKYQLEVISEEDRFGVFCSCPHFANGEACKHLWAAVRQADARLAKSESSLKAKNVNLSGNWQLLFGGTSREHTFEFPVPGENCPYYHLET